MAIKSNSKRLAPADSTGSERRPYMTGQDLLDSGLIGIWKHRRDIRSSVSFARMLRRQASMRRSS